MNYTLTIAIASASVSQIVAAGQYVTVVQSVEPYVQSLAMPAAFATTPALQLAWLALTPFQTTTVTWTSSYSLYAAVAPPANGSAVQTVATQSAQVGATYPFQSNVFGAPTSGTLPGYFVQNLQGSSMTFGLALSATVNGVSPSQAPTPINAVTVLNNQIGWFTPQVSVAVFLSTISTNGTAYYELGTPTYYSMASGSLALQYQASNSTFVPGS